MASNKLKWWLMWFITFLINVSNDDGVDVDNDVYVDNRVNNDNDVDNDNHIFDDHDVDDDNDFSNDIDTYNDDAKDDNESTEYTLTITNMTFVISMLPRMT